MEDCIFCKIIKKEIPSDIEYEDDEIIAFKDLHPVAPVHVLVIPKKHIDCLANLSVEDADVVSKIYLVIKKLAEENKIAESGYRVIVNCREDGGQIINHLHFHLIGGRKLGKKIAE